MKVAQKQKAITLRRKGLSMGEIAEKVGVSKSSVSYWVRDVVLTEGQRNVLNKNGHSIDSIEKRRISRLANTAKRRKEVMEHAAAMVPQLSRNALWCYGIALYWGEGGKTQQTARLANSDPDVIKVAMRFFREVCSVPEDKFHGHVHTFSNADAERAERYWSELTDIPRSRFYKTYVKKSTASKNKRKTLPYGTFQIYVHDTNFFFTLMGWIEELKKLGIK